MLSMIREVCKLRTLFYRHKPLMIAQDLKRQFRFSIRQVPVQVIFEALPAILVDRQPDVLRPLKQAAASAPDCQFNKVIHG